MIRQYIKQAWQLMKQNSCFSAVYIIGTGLAISMVMTMAVVWHIRMSDVAPEVSRSRSYFTSNATYKSKEQGYSSMSMLGYRLVRELLPELKVPERCCALPITGTAVTGSLAGLPEIRRAILSHSARA